MVTSIYDHESKNILHHDNYTILSYSVLVKRGLESKAESMPKSYVYAELKVYGYIFMVIIIIMLKVLKPYPP